MGSGVAERDCGVPITRGSVRSTAYDLHGTAALLPDYLSMNADEKICDLCGARAATDQIYYSRALSETEREKYYATEAELDMLLCENCSTQAFKHLKRMFTLQHLGLSRPRTRESRPRGRADRSHYVPSMSRGGRLEEARPAGGVGTADAARDSCTQER